jgi:hypothetical protein
MLKLYVELDTSTNHEKRCFPILPALVVELPPQDSGCRLLPVVRQGKLHDQLVNIIFRQLTMFDDELSVVAGNLGLLTRDQSDT